MKKILLTSIVMSLTFQVVISQSTRVEVPTEFFRNELRDGGLPPNVVGTPYETEDFQIGKIYIKDADPYMARVRYDAYRDNLEIDTDGKVSTLLKREYIKAEIGNKLYAIYEYQVDKNNVRKGYFKQLNNGDYKLLLKVKKEFKQGEEAASTYKKDSPPRFVDELTYYISTPDMKAKEVKLKKKSLAKILGKEKVASIADSKKLKLNSEQDVIMLLNTLNFSGNSK